MQISDHVTDPCTHWIRGWIVPQTRLDAVKDRNIFGPTENRTPIRMSSSSQPSHSNDWRKVLTPLCLQASLACRRNMRLLCNEQEACISRAPLTVRSYITSYKMNRYVLTFGPDELHFIHNCWRLRAYLYAHMRVIYRAVWGLQWTIRKRVATTMFGEYDPFILDTQYRRRWDHSSGNGSRAVIREYKTTAWTTEDRGSYSIRSIRDIPPVHSLHTCCIAFLASHASCRSNVAED